MKEAFNSTPECILKLKQLLTEVPILGYLTANDPFVVDTHASLMGMGAVLSQVQDGKVRVISSQVKQGWEQLLCDKERAACRDQSPLEVPPIPLWQSFHPSHS